MRFLLTVSVTADYYLRDVLDYGKIPVSNVHSRITLTVLTKTGIRGTRQAITKSSNVLSCGPTFLEHANGQSADGDRDCQK